MKNINFYLSDETLGKTLFNLLLKMVEAKYRVVIFCHSKEYLNELDEMLWTLGRVKFLPHGKEEDGYSGSHPVFLTTKEENPNKASFLFLFGKPSKEFIDKFDKSFYVFDYYHKDDAKTDWEDYRKLGFETVLMKKEGGKWVSSEKIDV